MTIKHLFPASKPTLDLNFAATRELDPRITFSRSSVGTYIDSRGLVQTAVDDEPRFDHDPVTGESLGLLIEESRTNSQKWSSDFSKTSSYNSSIINGDGAVPVLDSTLYEAPDGSVTAQRWTFQITDTTDGGNYSGIQAGTSGIPAGAYVTVWAKSATGADQTVFLTSQTNDTFTVTSKWQRFDLGPRSTIPLRVMARGTYTDAVVDILLWGVQMEAGSFPTSYIATSGSVEDRSADVCSIQGAAFSSWYNQSEGTMQVTFNVMNNSLNNERFLSAASSSNGNTTGYRYNASSVYAVQSSGANNWSSTGSWLSTGTVQGNNNFAFGYSPGSNATVRDGVIQETNTETVLVEQSSTALYMLNDISGHITRIAYYPRRLTDEQLEALTS